MAELTIDPATIRKALDDFVESYKPSDTPTQEVGYVCLLYTSPSPRDS